MPNTYITLTNGTTTNVSFEGDNGVPRVSVPNTAGANTATVNISALLGNDDLCDNIGAFITAGTLVATRGSVTLTATDMDYLKQGADMVKTVYDADDDNIADAAETISLATRTAVAFAASPYTVLAADTQLDVTTTGGVVVINLPVGVDGKMYSVKDLVGNAATNQITVTPNGAETIEGAATYPINANFAGITLYYNLATTDWIVSSLSGVLPSAHVLNTARSALWLAGNAPNYTAVNFAATPYAVLATDVVIGIDTVGGAIGITLPAGVDEKTYSIKDESGDAGTNAVTITPDGAETIEGAATYALGANYGGVVLRYNTATTDWKVEQVSAAALTPLDAQQMLNRTTLWLGGNVPARTAVNFAATPYAVQAADVVLDMTTVGGAIGLTLPAGVAGKMYTVKDIDGNAGANAVTITPDGAETIEGAATLVLNRAYIATTLYYDVGTTDWKVLQQTNYPTLGTVVHLQAVAATATDVVMLASGAGNITAIRAIPDDVAAAAESLTADVQIGGVTALTALATINNASAGGVVAGTVDLANDDFIAGDSITIVRTYVAGGGPTPITNTTVDVAYELA